LEEAEILAVCRSGREPRLTPRNRDGLARVGPKDDANRDLRIREMLVAATKAASDATPVGRLAFDPSTEPRLAEVIRREPELVRPGRNPVGVENEPPTSIGTTAATRTGRRDGRRPFRREGGIEGNESDDERRRDE